jgi:hypothetical protein
LLFQQGKRFVFRFPSLVLQLLLGRPGINGFLSKLLLVSLFPEDAKVSMPIYEILNKGFAL